MRYLLDTHILIWSFENEKKLSKNILATISNQSNELFFSSASLWEIAIKISNDKLKLEYGFSDFQQKLDKNKIFEIPVSRKYTTEIIELSHIHNDPFDRILIATAKIENMTIITVDKNIWQYNVECLW
ncbi:twitching motility protein PilT [Clostridia bacterium]|nr:twitching motility protein PilT [Clostridia bacterium]